MLSQPRENFGDNKLNLHFLVFLFRLFLWFYLLTSIQNKREIWYSQWMRMQETGRTKWRQFRSNVWMSIVRYAKIAFVSHNFFSWMQFSDQSDNFLLVFLASAAALHSFHSHKFSSLWKPLMGLWFTSTFFVVVLCELIFCCFIQIKNLKSNMRTEGRALTIISFFILDIGLLSTLTYAHFEFFNWSTLYMFRVRILSVSTLNDFVLK